MSAASEIVIITGSNTGLGFEAAKVLSKRDKSYKIIITSRSLSKSQAAVEELKKESKSAFFAYELDVASPSSIFSFAEKFKAEFDRLDVLVNNAGISLDRFVPPLEDTTADALQNRADLYQQTLQTNVIGPEVLTTALLPLLLKSSDPKLIFVSSGLGSLTMNADPDDMFYNVAAFFYRTSKSALNMEMLNWSKRLKDRNVKVYGVCPGYNATGLGGDAEQAAKFGAVPPSVGGLVIAEVVEGKRAGEENLVVGGEGKIRPW